MKKDMKPGVSLMSKSDIKETIKEAIDLEVKNEVIVIGVLGKMLYILYYNIPVLLFLFYVCIFRSRSRHSRHRSRSRSRSRSHKRDRRDRDRRRH